MEWRKGFIRLSDRRPIDSGDRHFVGSSSWNEGGTGRSSNISRARDIIVLLTNLWGTERLRSGIDMEFGVGDSKLST